MASKKALNPPRNECRQCWFHAYASREAHRHLKAGQDCPECVAHMTHMGGHPDHMIVR